MHCYRGSRDFIASGLNRRDGGKLAFNEGISDILSVPNVNTRKARAGTLGAHIFKTRHEPAKQLYLLKSWVRSR